MSFKLLAIRPLEGCDPEILKGLKPNCIYRFHNEYEYFNKQGEEIEIINKGEEIHAIKYTESVPNDLYGKNINISAIVGQNGSGKSTLLEIFYYFLFSYSRSINLLESTDSKNFHFEFYYLLNNEIHCIEWDNIKYHKKIIYSVDDDKVYKRCSENKVESFEKGNVYTIPIYNIITNYSIYGLNSNSEKDKWLDSLFIKNDGYQTPIVLNPYREDGNIDMNREFELANARLLKVFLSTSPDETENFNMTYLIKGVSVNKLLFKLSIDKNLKIYFNKENHDIEDVVNRFEKINSYKIKDFFENLYKTFGKNLKFSSFRFSYNRLDLLRNDRFVESCNDLSNLYIFKKIVKIVYGYKNYQVFKSDFDEKIIEDLNTIFKRNFSNLYQKHFVNDPKGLNE